MFENKTNTLSAPIFPRKKNGKSLQSVTGGNNVRSGEQKENLFFIDNNSDTKSALTLVSDYIDSLPRQSTHNYTKQTLYPGQIAYNSGLLPKVSTKAPEAGQSNSSANFVSSRRAKSHKHIVQVLCILNAHINNEEADEPASLNEAMA